MLSSAPHRIYKLQPWITYPSRGREEGHLQNSSWLGSMAAPTDQACLALEHSVRSRVPPILTDLYQFTMCYAYWRAGRHNEHAVFELFFRDNPFNGGFSVFAGLTDCMLFLRNFHFSEEGKTLLLCKLSKSVL